MPQSFKRYVTVALPNPFVSAWADIFLMASSQPSPLNRPEFTSVPFIVVNGSGGSPTPSLPSAGRGPGNQPDFWVVFFLGTIIHPLTPRAPTIEPLPRNPLGK